MQYFFLTSLVLLFNQYLYSGVQSVIVRDGTPLNTDRPPDGVAYCVDATKNDSICSSNPVEVLQGLHDQKTFEGISPGIVQRIDGTEDEKNSIMEILRLMNSYWYDEVLSNIEYADIRTSCQNKNNLCAFWAAIGECESNRVFMLPNCALACRFCLLQHANLVQHFADKN